MEQQEVIIERKGISNRVVVTIAALSAMLTIGIAACGGNDASPSKSPTTVRSKNAALTTTTTCPPTA